MAKSISGPMNAHLQEDTTSLAVGFLVERRDGKKFRFTASSRDALIDVGNGDGPQIFSAQEGFRRNNMANDAEMTVGDTQLVGIFDSLQLDENELRRGLFDGATISIFWYNHADLTMGIIRISKFEFGQVTATRRGLFRTELRDITAPFADRQLGEYITKDCRADLGDGRCRLPIDPPLFGRAQELTAGDFHKVQTTPPPERFTSSVLIVTWAGADTDITAQDFSDSAHSLTFNGDAQIDTAISQHGGSSLLLDGTGDWVEIPDSTDWNFGSGPFNVETYIRLGTIAGSTMGVIGQWSGASNQSWMLDVDLTGNNLRFRYSLNGTTVLTILGSFTWVALTQYHIAVSRTISGDVRLFVDGTQVGVTTSVTGTFFNSTAPLTIGAEDTGVNPFNGHIDDTRVSIVARYNANFVAPGPLVTEDPVIDQFVYGDRIYRVVTAGTTDADVQPIYDTTVTNQTTDGTAVLEAEHAWTRSAEVISVSLARRIFKVTELTPNSAGPRGGFPDTWFDGGVVRFDTGLNAQVAQEIRTFTADDGITIEQELELEEDTPFDIQVGDRMLIIPGDDKTFATCRDKFANFLNFVGEPFAPDNDRVGDYPDARA